MGFGEQKTIGRLHAGELVAALHDLVRPLAIGDAVFRDRLIEAHQGRTTTVAEQYHLRDTGHRAGVLDRSLDVEGNRLSFGDGVVVDVARVEAQNGEAAPG